jgi:adenylate kinase family enzyme
MFKNIVSRIKDQHSRKQSREQIGEMIDAYCARRDNIIKCASGHYTYAEVDALKELEDCIRQATNMYHST